MSKADDSRNRLLQEFVRAREEGKQHGVMHWRERAEHYGLSLQDVIEIMLAARSGFEDIAPAPLGDDDPGVRFVVDQLMEHPLIETSEVKELANERGIEVDQRHFAAASLRLASQGDGALAEEPAAEGELPARIPIPRTFGRTWAIGRVSDRTQFLADVFDDVPVFLVFDADGNLTRSEAMDDPSAAGAPQRREWLDARIAALGDPAWGHIRVKLFDVEVGGQRIVLFRDEDDGEPVEAHLYPYSMFFYAPWDGSHDT